MPSSSAAEPVVRLARVAKTYPSVPPVPALLPCDLDVHAGEHLSIMGPSGSGKSTLLNVLGLLDTPSEGEYMLDGIATASLSEAERCGIRARRIGFVFQSFHLVPYRSAVENVELGLLYQGMRAGARRELAIATLELVGLSRRMWAPPTQMSGGERQRVAIARALVRAPSLVLCDEPTGNLDTATGEDIVALLTRLSADEGLSVVLITHDPSIADAAGRVVRMRDGRVLEAVAAG
jgi:putative ABC transport system ATP-binding protein